MKLNIDHGVFRRRAAVTLIALIVALSPVALDAAGLPGRDGRERFGVRPLAAAFSPASGETSPSQAQSGRKRPQSKEGLVAAEKSLTLDQAIASALEKNDDIRIERAALDSAKAAVVGAKGAYDPRVTAGAGWQSTTAPVNSAFSGAPSGELAPTDRTLDANASIQELLRTGAVVSLSADSSRATTDGAFALLSPAYGTRIGLEFRQPLLRDRAIDGARATLRIASAGRELAAGSLRRQVTETINAVERAYWTLVAARRAVDVQKEAVGLAMRQLDETKTRIESGASPETDVAQPRAELERRRGDLLAAKEAVSRAETALKNLILGDETRAWSEALTPVDPIEVKVAPVDASVAMDEALASRPELVAAKAAAAERRIESTYASDQLKPALDLVVSYDRYGLAGSANPAGTTIPGVSGNLPPTLEGNLGDALSQLGSGDFDDARAGVQLRFPIGNRTARANARIAKNAELQANAEIERLRKQIRGDVLDAVAATETAGARIEAARAAREAAEVQLSAEQDRFEAGLSTNFLVLTRQNDLAAAKLAEIKALTDYRMARTELERATGSLLSEHGIEIE